MAKPDLCAIVRDHAKHGRQWRSYYGWSKHFYADCIWLSSADAKCAAEGHPGAYVVQFVEKPPPKCTCFGYGSHAKFCELYR